ncbi:hypothetical protein [Rhodococcus qingshengii]|uniref:hypothetical protein n=1 Tax=Rhodococcus qingshengii TaxID=334542 RepID=UPI001F131477|nr:hypothetical protein [Rhodococcus qingshengii]ULD38908.1 hypothetical protein JKI97_01020 [Rhodococcus qingshengii]
MESQEMTTPEPLTCTACGATHLPSGHHENSCSEEEAGSIPAGWTNAYDETYCPICADVRARTWGSKT